MNDPFDAPNARRLAIFGHPTHELAILGLVQRHRPHVLVLTDGGSETRIAESTRGFELLGLADRVTYLRYSEASFYQALIEGDTALFCRIADEIREHIERHDANQLFCDAVEFYNPVHDITLPMVMRAMAGRTTTGLWEVPLVYQKPAAHEHYEIQRVPEALASRRCRYTLSKEELAAKVHARNEVHLALHHQAGPEFLAATEAHLATEELLKAENSLPGPDESIRVLRYEWRAKLLQSEGAITQTITYQGHFLPMAKHLSARFTEA